MKKPINNYVRLAAVLPLAMAIACGDDDSPVDAADASVPDAVVNDVPFDVEADSFASDVGHGDDVDAVDGGAIDAGAARVPLFLAVGWGGRRIVSCDMGRSWIADAFESTEDDWHQTYTPKSLAYHDGLFVHMTGWGTPSTIHVSRNGIDWTSVPLGGRTAGAVGYDGRPGESRWVALSGRAVRVSDDALEWSELEAVDGSGLNRDGAVYPGIWVSGTDGMVRYNLGEGWVDLASCTGARHGSIGVHGGFAAGPDRVVSFGDDGTTCVIDRATGADLGAGEIGTDRVQGVGAFVNDEFWLGSRGVLYRSPDGLTWTDQPLPDGVEFSLVADSGQGTIAAANRNGDAFYYSDDAGISWTRAEGPEGNNLYRMIFGWAEPSEMCPAR